MQGCVSTCVKFIPWREKKPRSKPLFSFSFRVTCSTRSIQEIKRVKYRHWQQKQNKKVTIFGTDDGGFILSQLYAAIKWDLKCLESVVWPKATHVQEKNVLNKPHKTTSQAALRVTLWLLMSPWYGLPVYLSPSICTVWQEVVPSEATNYNISFLQPQACHICVLSLYTRWMGWSPLTLGCPKNGV